MPRDDKKVTLDDILAEYNGSSSPDSSPKDNIRHNDEDPENMEISEEFFEEITVSDDEDLDDVEIVEEPFLGPDPEHTWEEAGITDIPIISGTFDTPGADSAAGGEADSEAADSGDTDEEADSEAVNSEAEAMNSEAATADETEEAADEAEEDSTDRDITVQDGEDVNDIFLARFAKSIFPVKGDSVGEIIRKIIFLIAVIVFIGAGIMLISTLIQSGEAKGIQESNQSVIVTTVATSIDSDGNIVTIPPTPEEIAEHNLNVAEYYKAINEDYIGYLEVPGCDIYEPVVKGDDNEYYLSTKISGGYNKAGTVFMDYRCTISDEYTSPNLVIYGHNQEDGTMFGRLKYYKQDVEFYKENPVIRFSTDTETWEYLVYGFFVTHVYEKQSSDGIVFHYHDYINVLKNRSTFDWYLGEVQSRNQIISPVDVQYGDDLLCLSTCSNEFTDSRFVVFARRLREGESVSDYDFSQARLNPYAQGVDWDAIMSEFTSEEETSYDELPDDELSEVVTSEKSLNKKNVRTETSANETEAVLEETSETTVTTVPAETEETSVTVVPSESASAETETETADSSASGVSGTDSSESADSSSSGDGSGSGDSGDAGDSSGSDDSGTGNSGETSVS
ncbi:MAG: class B sortase [Oscillospiraceae bacterium]|nr:class B sortase [Oscillospiraceae bacterium]